MYQRLQATGDGPFRIVLTFNAADYIGKEVDLYWGECLVQFHTIRAIGDEAFRVGNLDEITDDAVCILE
ncbi:hypothetical protein ACX0G9_15680 [Flavitalea flava]